MHEQPKKRCRVDSLNSKSIWQTLGPKINAQDSWSSEVTKAISADGFPLETETIAFMELRFGHDFSEVRIHADANAAKSARRLNARAFTVANDIVFDNQQYNPKTKEGKRLIAHELSHVVQQEGNTRTLSSELELTKSSDAAEMEADVAANRVIGGEAVTIQTKSTPIVARDSYADEAYNILNTPMSDEERLRFLLEAENMSLAERGVPAASLGTLPANSHASGQMDFQNWQLDINPQRTQEIGTPEQQAALSSTLAHEGEHLAQWYEMARLQAGTGNTSGPLSQIPVDIATQARAHPILQSDENTYQIQQWYESVYGIGANHRGEVLRGEDPANLVSQWRQDEYCRLPEERDAWARGMQVTDQFRRIEGQSAPAWDPSACNPNELMTPANSLDVSQLNASGVVSNGDAPLTNSAPIIARQENTDNSPGMLRRAWDFANDDFLGFAADVANKVPALDNPLASGFSRLGPLGLIGSPMDLAEDIHNSNTQPWWETAGDMTAHTLALGNAVVDTGALLGMVPEVAGAAEITSLGALGVGGAGALAGAAAGGYAAGGWLNDMAASHDYFGNNRTVSEWAGDVGGNVHNAIAENVTDRFYLNEILGHTAGLATTAGATIKGTALAAIPAIGDGIMDAGGWLGNRAADIRDWFRD